LSAVARRTHAKTPVSPGPVGEEKKIIVLAHGTLASRPQWARVQSAAMRRFVESTDLDDVPPTRAPSREKVRCHCDGELIGVRIENLLL